MAMNRKPESFGEGWFRTDRAVRPLSILFVILGTAGALRPAPADGRTWIVHADGTGDAPTIQAGIDSAAAGDTVLVTAGTHTALGLDGTSSLATAVMKSGIVLRSADGPEQTWIDVTSSLASRGIHCSGCDASTVVEGFTISGGDAFHGASIYIDGGAPLIQGNILVGAYGGAGGSMFVTGAAAPVISGNRFASNIACCGVGGAMLVQGGSAPQILGNVFVGNSGFGGGAVAFNGASGLLEGNEFTSNTGTDGGALALYNSDPLVRGNTLTGNHSTNNGGAVAFFWSSATAFHDNIVTGNIADGSGGGIFVNGASPEVVRTTIAGNSATAAGGIFITGSSAPVFDRVLVAFNGGSDGILCDDPAVSASFTCCDVFGNDGSPYAGFCPDPTGQSGNIAEDPFFCAGTYSLEDCSPCVQGYGCGQIGALGSACSCTGQTAAEQTSWGGVKSIFR